MATNWCNLLQLKPAICLLKKELVSLVGLENIVDVLNLSFDVCFRNVFHVGSLPLLREVVKFGLKKSQRFIVEVCFDLKV